MAAIPERIVEKFQVFLTEKVPEHVRDQIRNEVTVRGKSLTVWECRPPYLGETTTEWDRVPVAQFRLDTETQRWTVFWADRNDKWLRYPNETPTKSISRLLWLLDEDPHCCIWG